MSTQNFSKLDLDKISPNRNILPLTAEVDNAGRLKVADCYLSELADEFGTPLYVLDELTIRQSCKAYNNALKKHYPGESLVLYASKANSSLVIGNIMKSEKMGIDVVSEGELITALKSGFVGSQIFLHGNNKSDKELILAYENDINIVIDNQHDISRLDSLLESKGKIVNLMLRFTPGIECHTHEYIKTGHLDSKFGFDPDNIFDVLNDLKTKKWANLTGLHAHIGSQIFELQPHRDLINIMIDTFISARKIGHPIKDLNIGGGLGIKYIESDDPPSINSWVEIVSNQIINTCKQKDIKLPRLICEPGRSIIATSGVTLYRVGAIKSIPGIRKYISVDGGMSDNPRPITYQSNYTACLVESSLEKPNELVTIAGKHCESGDVLLKDFLLPESRSGDVLAVFGTGAYNASMSSNYNRIPRPATIILLNGKADLVQKRELPEDLLRFDLVPDRFITKG